MGVIHAFIFSTVYFFFTLFLSLESLPSIIISLSSKHKCPPNGQGFEVVSRAPRPKTTRPEPESEPKPPKDKRRWRFVKSYREKSSNNNSRPRPHSYDATSAANATATSSVAHPESQDDASKHAIAVAAATAAVAAAVVRLTHSGRCNTITPPVVPPRLSGGGVGSYGGEREVWATVIIQSHFRGYLARRALRALKGLVKLQALVRGHIMRRKTTETMRCMQAMLRAQARARSVRAYIPESPHSSSKSCPLHQPGPPTPEKFELFVRAKSAQQDQSPKIKRNGSRSSSRTISIKKEGRLHHHGQIHGWTSPHLMHGVYLPLGLARQMKIELTEYSRWTQGGLI